MRCNMKENKEKILLTLFPFWMPLIPPLGIACLKSYLKSHGYIVKAHDFNTIVSLRDFYDSYFNTIAEHVPAEKKGNFYSIGQDVLRNHLMAHINKNDEKEYLNLIKILIYKTFYTHFDDEIIRRLIREMEKFYHHFQKILLGLLDDFKPDVLGISLFSGNLPTAWFAIKLIKELYPKMRIVLGGGAFADQLAIGTPNMDYFLKKVRPYVDKIIIGEGEILFHKYLKGELNENQMVYTLKDIDWELLDIKNILIPDFSDFPLKVYPNMVSYTSRSCPFQCSFCSETVQWGKYRKRSGQQIVNELTELYRQYGEQLFFMSESLINPALTDLVEAFLKSNLSIYWDGAIRADAPVCDTQNTMLWRRGGFYRARIGLESGSQRILDLMGKKITLQQMQKALQSLAYAGIKTSTLWLIGHPGEREEDFQSTLDFITEFRDFIYAAEGTPFWYHLKGQSNSDEWYKRRSTLLYPESAKEMLIAQTWILDGDPTREETYDRLCRFTLHLEKLDIPTPYSLQDIYNADTRWQKLHKNAVPPLVDLKNPGRYIDENKKIMEFSVVRNKMRHDQNWGF